MLEKFETKLSGLNSDAIVAELKVNTNISAQEAQLQFNNYYSRVQEIYKECFMENIELNNSKRNFSHKPWITLAIAKSCLTKNKLCRIKVGRRGKSGYEDAKNANDTYRSKLRDVIRISRETHFKNVLKNAKAIFKKLENAK